MKYRLGIRSSAPFIHTFFISPLNSLIFNLWFIFINLRVLVVGVCLRSAIAAMSLLSAFFSFLYIERILISNPYNPYENSYDPYGLTISMIHTYMIYISNKLLLINHFSIGCLSNQNQSRGSYNLFSLIELLNKFRFKFLLSETISNKFQFRKISNLKTIKEIILKRFSLTCCPDKQAGHHLAK